MVLAYKNILYTWDRTTSRLAVYSFSWRVGHHPISDPHHLSDMTSNCDRDTHDQCVNMEPIPNDRHTAKVWMLTRNFHLPKFEDLNEVVKPKIQPDDNNNNSKSKQTNETDPFLSKTLKSWAVYLIRRTSMKMIFSWFKKKETACRIVSFERLLVVLQA